MTTARIPSTRSAGSAGGEVVKVDSCFKRIGTPDINWVQSTLQFDNGATGVVINSWASGRRVFRTEIHCPGAYADVSWKIRRIFMRTATMTDRNLTARKSRADRNFMNTAGLS